jgi:hypothetical protein
LDVIGTKVLKGQYHEIFDFWFFHESVSPKPLSTPLHHLGRFEFFQKFGETFAAQGAPPVLLTPVANGKTSIQRNFNYFVWTTLGSKVKIYCIYKFLPSSSL